MVKFIYNIVKYLNFDHIVTLCAQYGADVVSGTAYSGQNIYKVLMN